MLSELSDDLVRCVGRKLDMPALYRLRCVHWALHTSLRDVFEQRRARYLRHTFAPAVLPYPNTRFGFSAPRRVTVVVGGANEWRPPICFLSSRCMLWQWSRTGAVPSSMGICVGDYQFRMVLADPHMFRQQFFASAYGTEPPVSANPFRLREFRCPIVAAVNFWPSMRNVSRTKFLDLRFKFEGAFTTHGLDITFRGSVNMDAVSLDAIVNSASTLARPQLLIEDVTFCLK